MALFRVLAGRGRTGGCSSRINRPLSGHAFATVPVSSMFTAASDRYFDDLTRGCGSIVSFYLLQVCQVVDSSQINEWRGQAVSLTRPKNGFRLKSRYAGAVGTKCDQESSYWPNRSSSITLGVWRAHTSAG